MSPTPQLAKITSFALADTHENKDEKNQADQAGLSLFATAAQSLVTMMGAGILTLAWAFHYSTLWPGIILSMVMCVFAGYSYYILGVCSEITGEKNYGQIWEKTFGERTAWIPNCISLGITYLSIVAFLTIIGDYLPLAIQSLCGVQLQRKVVIVCVWSFLMPLNFLKDLSFLGPVSILGTLGALYTCVLLFVKSVEYGDEHSDWVPFKLGSGIFLTIPSLTFTYNCHFNAPDIYQRLERRSPFRWMVVTASAYALAFVVAVVCGVSGYIMLGSELSLPGRSNVLTAPLFYGQPEAMFAYVATCLSVSMGIPLYSRSACDALELLVLSFSKSRDALGSNRTRSNLVMAFIQVSTLLTAMLVGNLGLINAVAGSLCASLNMCVLPSLMYLKLAGAGARDHRLPPLMGNREVVVGLPFHIKLLNWLCIILGIVVAVTGITTSIMDAIGFCYHIESLDITVCWRE